MPKFGAIPADQQDQGKTAVAGAESRTNTAYGLLATPDRVQSVVMPTDGLIVVAYKAIWQESVAGAGRAALFVGGNQVVVPDQSGGTATEAAAFTGASATDYRLVSTPYGLATHIAAGMVNAADVATGQAMSQAASGGGGLLADVGGSVSTGPLAVSPLCWIFAAAGTYDISVQFKASSGSVTVKNRKLWVWSRYFG